RVAAGMVEPCQGHATKQIAPWRLALREAKKRLAAALRLLPRPPAWAASRALPQAFFWLL
ncbi:MAG TPA: hypothetical protein PLN16_04845, partial [Ottowia sp.]|nr:hypothetical protein [Ottowia sp.]